MNVYSFTTNITERQKLSLKQYCRYKVILLIWWLLLLLLPWNMSLRCFLWCCLRPQLSLETPRCPLLVSERRKHSNKYTWLSSLRHSFGWASQLVAREGMLTMLKMLIVLTEIKVLTSEEPGGSVLGYHDTVISGAKDASCANNSTGNSTRFNVAISQQCWQS